MKQIHSLDVQLETYNITDPFPVVHGYRKARELDLDLMILHDFGLHQHAVPAIVEALRRHGIEKVALTHASSNIMGILWAFAKAGATLEMGLIVTGEEDTFDTFALVAGCTITVN